ncbi:MAG: hypothetical protein AVDCRST_MAG01-01-1037, partial [uncultured Rubrobacteraceae bacterium]
CTVRGWTKGGWPGRSHAPTNAWPAPVASWSRRRTRSRTTSGARGSITPTPCWRRRTSVRPRSTSTASWIPRNTRNCCLRSAGRSSPTTRRGSRSSGWSCWCACWRPRRGL